MGSGRGKNRRTQSAAVLDKIKRWKAAEIETTDGPGLIVLKSDLEELMQELAPGARLLNTSANADVDKIKRWRATEIETTDGPGLVILKSDLEELLHELARRPAP